MAYNERGRVDKKSYCGKMEGGRGTVIKRVIAARDLLRMDPINSGFNV